MACLRYVAFGAGRVSSSRPDFHSKASRRSPLLASGAAYPHQAFRYGDTAYGLQFPDSATWSAWREHLPAGLLEGKDLKQHLIEHMGKAVIRNFFDVALSDGDPLSSSQQTIETG